MSTIVALQQKWDEQEARIRMAQDQVSKLRTESMVPTPEPYDNILTAQYPAYAEAKRRLEEQRQFRSVLGTKIAQQQTDLALPRSMPVQIVDHATANHRPVRPNKPLNVFLGALLGIVLGTVAGGSIAGISFLNRRGPSAKPDKSGQAEAAA